MSDTPLHAPTWRIFPTVMVRAAGMPYRMLAGLASPRTVGRAERAASIESRLRTSAPELIRSLALERHRRPPDAPCGDLRRAERMVRAGRLVPDHFQDPELRRRVWTWNDLVEERAAAARGLEAAWADERRAAESALERLAEREDVQEAIFVNSPDALQGIRRLGRTGSEKRHRYVLRTLVRYVERLAAKTETGSFFGPLNWGVAREGGGPNLALTVSGDGRAAARRATMSFWAAQALADHYAADPACAPLLRAYRSARLEPAAGQADPRLWPLADGRHTAQRMAAVLGWSLEATLERLRDLEVRGHLRLGLWLPSSCADPLAALDDLLTGAEGETRERLLAELAWWRAWLASWSRATLCEKELLLPDGERRFRAATGMPARRGAGRVSGDRFILVEEACGNIPSLAVGGELLERLTWGLSVALDVVASRAVDRRCQERAALRACLPQLAVGPVAIDAIPSLAAASDERWLRGWRRLIPDPSQREVRLSREELMAAGLIRPDLDDWPLLCAPDVMIAARDVEAVNAGDFQLVLSEAHHLLPPATLPFSAYHPESEAVLARLRDELAELVAPATAIVQVVWRRNKAMDFIPFGQPALCLDWVRPEPRSTPVPASELAVELSAGGRPVVTWLGVEGAELAIVPDYPDMEPELGGLRALAIPEVMAVPVSLGGHTPRIVIEGLVFQRERWSFLQPEFPAPGDAPWSPRAFAALWEWKEAHRLPDLVFVSTDAEAKPVLVDFRSIASCEVFVHLLRQAGSISVTEMLPRPDQLWLGAGADAFSCELRLTLLRSGSGRRRGGR